MSSTPPVSALSDHLGFWLRMVSNHVSQAFSVRLAAEGVTVAEWTCLRALHDCAPAAPTRLAQHMGMTRGAITRLADRLIAKELVSRAANAHDGRAQILSLTASGLELLPKLAGAADANDAAFFDALSMDERAALRELLMRIVARSHITVMPLE